MTELKRVVIIGAGVGGYTAAGALRENGYDGEIVLISGEDYLPYDRPPLSKKVLTGEWSRDKITFKPEEFYTEQQINIRLGARVIQINAKEHTVRTEKDEIFEYSDLIIATGGRPRKLDVRGRDLDGIHNIGSYAQTRRIRSELEDANKVVVIGAGFIGAEAAAACVRHGKDVTVIEVSPAPMEYALGEEAGQAIAKLFGAENVKMDFGTTVSAYSGDGGRVRAVHTYDGRSFEAELVIEAVGFVPNIEIAEAAGCRIDGGVIVDEYMRTSVPNIYAIGDIARYPSTYANGPRDPSTRNRVRIEHWAVAIDHGVTAAKTICGLIEPYDKLPWFWSDQFDITYNYAGHATDWDEIVWRGDPTTGSFSVFYLQDAKLAAALCANRSADFRGAKLILEHAYPVDRAVLQDPDQNLYRYAKAQVKQ